VVIKDNMREFSDEIQNKTKTEIESSKNVYMANLDEIISPMFHNGK